MPPSTNAHPDLRIAYVLDPRFMGGTSSAVAAELEVVHQLGQVQVYALETKMFSGRYISPQLNKALVELGISLTWADREISADIVIFHNPSCLKFQDEMAVRIVARHLLVVTHENFLRPGGAEAFDVTKCLDQIARGSIVLSRHLAPISAWNRSTIETWQQGKRIALQWPCLRDDWFNICAFEKHPPTQKPRDRRGRHSRAGLEKFPSRAVMDTCFPETSEKNIILGGDRFIGRDDVPTFWELHPFGGLALPLFFERFDFFVYYTAPTWRESFGRVVAEAVAAGKMVITDSATAANFQGAAIGANPVDVDQIVASYVANPKKYQADVLTSQACLDRFSADAFKTRMLGVLGRLSGQSI